VGCPVATSARIYRPRRPRESPLYQLLDRYYDRFERVYDQRYQKRYGFWRPVIWRTVDLAAGRRCLRIKVLACGDLKEGFARVRCPRCRYEFFFLSTTLPLSKLPPEARPSRLPAHRPRRL